jgi:hypothetical protein
MIYQRPSNQKRKPAQRLQSGLAGSALIRTDRELESVKPVPLPVVKSAAELLAEREQANREKLALAARNRRKQQSEQIKRIKAALSIPIEQRKEQARQKRKAERVPSMFDGAGMTDVDGRAIGPVFATGGFNSEKLDQMDQVEQQDSGRVAPEGRGIDSNGDRDESYDEGGENQGSRFHVDLDVDASFRQRIMAHIFNDYIQNIGTAIFPENGEDFESLAVVCRLCLATLPHDEVTDHIVSTHGAEDEPGHDRRFGNIIEKMSRKLIREDRERRRALKPRQSPEQFLNTMRANQSSREAKATKEGFVKGPYVWDPVRRRHVQGWVPASKAA